MITRIDKNRGATRGFANYASREARLFVACLVFLLATSVLAFAADGKEESKSEIEVKVNWNKIEHVSKTTSTLQVVVNPLLRRSSPIHDQAFHALRYLQADYVRYVPWYPYPKLGVAELEPPTERRASCDGI